MSAVVTLAVAILAEITATLALKAADGFTRPGPTVLVVLGYGTALWLMSSAVGGLPIGMVYAVWAGVGMVGAALGGALFFHETVSPATLAGIGIIALGIGVLAAAQG